MPASHSYGHILGIMIYISESFANIWSGPNIDNWSKRQNADHGGNGVNHVCGIVYICCWLMTFVSLKSMKVRDGFSSVIIIDSLSCVC